MKFSVEFFQEEDGSESVSRYLDALKLADSKLWKSTLASIEKIKDSQCHRNPITKPLGEGLFELRTRANKTISRIFFCFQQNRKIILLHGFTKKTERIPIVHLKLAISRMKRCKK